MQPTDYENLTQESKKGYNWRTIIELTMYSYV